MPLVRPAGGLHGRCGFAKPRQLQYFTGEFFPKKPSCYGFDFTFLGNFYSCNKSFAIFVYCKLCAWGASLKGHLQTTSGKPIMIDLYTWTTPNGRKISIALEEMGADYTVKPINIREGEQFKPDFLTISPNNKIPAIVDHETGTSVFESIAILIYLAEKSEMFLPVQGTKERAKVLEWLMWQTAGFGPMLGQLKYFSDIREDKIPEAIERFATEAMRLYRVLDEQLGRETFVAGDFSIADMAIYPWSALALKAVQEASGQGFLNVMRWHKAMEERPAVVRGMAIPSVTA